MTYLPEYMENPNKDTRCILPTRVPGLENIPCQRDRTL